MNENEIEQLMAKFDQSSLQEFQLVQDAFQLTFSKRKQIPIVPVKQEVAEASVSEDGAQPLSEKPVSSTETATAVKAPLVGVVTFEDPIKQVGDTIHKGDVLCSIEAMKMANEVKSPVTGIIRAVLVDDQTMVEYDQPLFEIEEGVA